MVNIDTIRIYQNIESMVNIDTIRFYQNIESMVNIDTIRFYQNIESISRKTIEHIIRDFKRTLQGVEMVWITWVMTKVIGLH